MESSWAGHRYSIRFFEVIVPVLSWVLITLPIWLSPSHPAVVAYFVLTFNLYFFYKSAKTVYHAVLSYKTILYHQSIPYKKKIRTQSGARDLTHFFVIPNYKEPLYKLEHTIENIRKNEYPYGNIYIVLAFEKRETEAARKAASIRRKFGSSFTGIIDTYHELMPEEAAGKASNQTWAVKHVSAYVREKGIDPRQCLITICDADSLFPPNFLSYLSYEFLRDSGRLYHFYWAPVLLYNNFGQLPFFVRMQATLSSIFRLATLTQKEKLIQISTYSTNLWLLEEINYWDVDIIPEDWHVHFQAFFKFGDKVRTIPLFTIVNGDAVYSGGVVKTLFNRYEQEKRWAWGVSDIGYALQKCFSPSPVPFFTKIKKVTYLAETHLLWPTSFFILTVSALLPPLINPYFKRTVLGFLLPQLSSVLLTLSTSFLLVYTFLDVKLRGKLKQKTKYYALPLLVVQWYLLPVVSFFLSSLPALDAHTRMILGKKLEYKVTEKV